MTGIGITHARARSRSTLSSPTFLGSREGRTGEYIQLFCLLCYRVVDDAILLTMDDGRSALKALELDGKEVTKQKYCSIASVPITFAWGILRNHNVQNLAHILSLECPKKSILCSNRLDDFRFLVFAISHAKSTPPVFHLHGCEFEFLTFY